MLQRSERLSRTQFAEFGRKGKRFHSEALTVSFLPYATFHGAVVVSKKVSKSAVRRNKLRRQVYAQLQTTKQSGKIGVFVCVVKPEAEKMTSAQFRGAVKNIIERTGKPA
jgi:ribonuclease P protein component